MSEPIIYNNKTINRGVSSSADFNSIMLDAMTDLAILSEYINENEELITDSTEIIRNENMFLKARVTELESILEDVKSVHENILNNNNSRISRQLVSNFAYTRNINCHFDNMYNIATPSISKIYEKFRLESAPNPYIKVRLYESFDNQNWVLKYNESTNKKMLNMFDGSYNMCFARTSRTLDTSKSAIYARLEIDVPTNTVNNIVSNCIKLNPIPEYSMDIISIEYKNPLNGAWQLIPTYPTQNSSPLVISKIPAMAIVMPNTEMLALRLTIRQPNYTSTTDAATKSQARDFFYGFQEIALQYIEAMPGDSAFVTKFDIHGKSKFFDVILKPELIVNSWSNQAIDCRFELYGDQNLSSQFIFGSQIPININTVYVKTIVKMSGGIIPAVSGIKLTYTTR